jgi:transcriptional regulator with XRE-family HTH domain
MNTCEMAPTKSRGPGDASPPDFQRRIKSLRLRLKMTQSEFALALGVQVKQITRWENGENAPRIAQLNKITEVSGVTHQWLMAGAGEDGVSTTREPYPSLVGFLSRRPDVTSGERRHLESIDLGAHSDKGSDDYWSGVLSFYRGLIVNARAVVRVDAEVDATMKTLAARKALKVVEIDRDRPHPRKPVS